MQIFSKGNLYIGKDDESFTTVLIHLGNYRLEFDWKPESNGSRPTTKESN
jgi:hypothetical protein